MQTKKPSYALPIGGGAAAVLFLLVLRGCLGGPPSDARLARQFEKNRPRYLELRAMLSTNSPGAGNQIEPVVSTLEDYERFRKLLKQTEVSLALIEGNEFRFYLSREKPAPKEFRLAVVWTDLKPDRMVTNLQAFRKTAGPTEQAYRELGEGWYLWSGK